MSANPTFFQKVATFFREASPLKIILIGFPIGLVSQFIEKPYPNLFLGMRLLIFMLFIYACVKYFSSK